MVWESEGAAICVFCCSGCSLHGNIVFLQQKSWEDSSVPTPRRMHTGTPLTLLRQTVPALSIHIGIIQETLQQFACQNSLRYFPSSPLCFSRFLNNSQRRCPTSHLPLILFYMAFNNSFHHSFKLMSN